ncbi:MAG: LysM peptidoglycan-binding domain-containing M23 family metallopeptidase [Bacillota bacterium]
MTKKILPYLMAFYVYTLFLGLSLIIAEKLQAEAVNRISAPRQMIRTGEGDRGIPEGKVEREAPRYYKVVSGDTLSKIAARFHIGIKKIIIANRIKNPNLIYPGQILLLNGWQELASRSAFPPISARISALLPIPGKLTSYFGMRRGRMHNGIDIAAPGGTPIPAYDEGIVIFAGWRQGYGKMVEIRHPDGWITRYAHCSSFLVKPGDAVSAKQPVATVGCTGRATGNHLHFEIVIRKQHVNPLYYLKGSP